MARRYYVYILANRSRTLYVGVTGGILRRLDQHHSRTASAFTRRYLVRRLVHIEESSNIRDAIAREKEIKRWRRQRKLELIAQHNPEWVDLSAAWLERR
jgi:putative endonuclease